MYILMYLCMYICVYIYVCVYIYICIRQAEWQFPVLAGQAETALDWNHAGYQADNVYPHPL